MFTYDGKLFTEIENNSWVLFGRFICASVLHLSLLDEVQQSLNMMKFCLNHEYLFFSPHVAFAVASFQYISTLMVEICNLGIII